MKLTKLRPLHDQIFFRFEEVIISGSKGTRMFETQSHSGIVVMGNADDSTKAPKWGEVIAIGPTVTDVEIGQTILIEPMMWTNAIRIKDEPEFWKTDQTKIIGIRPD